jgi:hypothetical protein
MRNTTYVRVDQVGNGKSLLFSIDTTSLAISNNFIASKCFQSGQAVQGSRIADLYSLFSWGGGVKPICAMQDWLLICTSLQPKYTCSASLTLPYDSGAA